MADSIEQALLFSRDMEELWNLKKHEVFLTLKRNLVVVSSRVQAPNPYPFFFNIISCSSLYIYIYI